MDDRIERLAQLLVDAGVSRAFGVSGSGPSYRLIHHLRCRGVAYVPVSHESAAPVAAGVYERLTGRRAVALAIKGPGFANLLAGMASAYLEGYSPICIAERYDDETPAERMHKRLNQQSMAMAIVDATFDLTNLDGLETFLATRRFPTRPLYVELGSSEPEAMAGRPIQALPAAHSDARLASALGRIAQATRVVLIAGQFVARSGRADALAALRIPILTSAQAKGAIDERRPNAAGVYTGVGRSLSPEHALLPPAELVVSIGLRNMEILGVAGKRDFVNLDIDHPLITGDDIVVTEAEIDDVLMALAEKPAWAEDVIDTHRCQWAAYVESHHWMPGQVFTALNMLDEPHALVLDTGTFCTVGEHAWQATRDRVFAGSSNGRSLGLGVPHALGTSLAKPGVPVFCVVGDGGIRYYLADIRTIACLHLPVCFILMTDGQYGSIASNVAPLAPERAILAPLGTSWTGVMSAMGLAGGEARDLDSFHHLLSRWNRQDSYFIETPFDPVEYLRVAAEVRA